jgi:hypothetical protein
MMLRNSSDIFITHSTSKKFLNSIENLLSSSRTSPIVKERVLDVIAAGAYASGSHTAKYGFKALWARVKPADAPEEVCDMLRSTSLPSLPSLLLISFIYSLGHTI